MILIFILLLAVFNMTAVHSLEEAALLSRLEPNVSESAKFRAMRLGPAMPAWNGWIRIRRLL